MKKMVTVAALALGLGLFGVDTAPAQVRVDVQFGYGRPYWGQSYRVYRPHPRPYYGRSYRSYYDCGYHGCGREVVVVRPYRPRPYVVRRGGRYHGRW